MRFPLFPILLIWFVLVSASCGQPDHVPPKPQSAAIPHEARIQTAEDAIAVVRHATKRRGGDPTASEYHAHRSGKDWFVKAWHIRYPDETGSSRFVPGGFTTYTVGNDGRILATMPGR
jgi:hypothetical protein